MFVSRDRDRGVNNARSPPTKLRCTRSTHLSRNSSLYIPLLFKARIHTPLAPRYYTIPHYLASTRLSLCK
ncbi:unnamed protein product [Gulo gulo]|uniref:Uncharacterized protein n=1 Tax=Gulo gulo TaxID=48420 RepID=A0A9X9LH65_GULGU|nr:unnamed protein product [Gulo gulo]